MHLVSHILKDTLLVHAAITKISWIRWLNNRSSFLRFLEAGKSKIKVPAGAVSGEGPLPRRSASLCVFPWWKERESTLGSFCEDTNRIHKGLILFTQSSPNTPSLIPSHWGLGFNIWMREGHKHSVHSTKVGSLWVSSCLVYLLSLLVFPYAFLFRGNIHY